LPRLPRPIPDAFEPEGLLELALVEHAAGRIDREAVMRAFARSRVFIPSQDDVLDVAEGAPFRPVLLDAGGKPVVATCTSAARLRGLLRAVPHVTSGIEVEAAWVIQHAGGELGVVIDPGWSVALVIAAEDLARPPG
jgi:hypothetical protein